MPFRFLRNPLGAAGSFIRRVVTLGADQLRDPLTRVLHPEHILGVVGRHLGSIGRAFAERGAILEAAAVRAAARREAEILVDSGRLTGMPEHTIIDDHDIPDAVTKIRRRYAWTVRARYIDPNTGETVSRYLTVSTNDRLSRAEVLDTAINMLGSEYEISSGQTIDVDVDRVVKAGEGGML